MRTTTWQKQNINLQKTVWGISAVISSLLIILLLSLGYRIQVAGVFFILVFAILRILLAYIFNNRYANSMVRLLKFDYEEIERDFRFVFKNKFLRYKHITEEEAYSYEFPWRKLTMTVQPYWRSGDMEPVTKVTLHKLTAKNEAFAEMLAEAIDEMALQLANKRITAPRKI